MLVELRTRNFAVIREARVEFTEAFNVLTGETGAGKSLLIDALLAIGGRGGADFVKTGAETAEIEAVFQMNGELKAAFEELAEGDYISLRKVISKTAKPKQYINGAFASQARCRELLGALVHVYGQSEAKELYDAAYHAELFDCYCDNASVRERLRENIREARVVAKELADLKACETGRAQELDFLSYQIAEIRDAGLERDDEEEELNRKRAVLLAREKIMAGVNGAYETLYGSEGSVFDLLGKTEKLLSDAASVDNRLDDGARDVRSIAEGVKNRAYELKGYADGIEFSDDDQNAIEARLDLLYRLKKKYGGTIHAARAYLAEAERKCEALSHLERDEGQKQNQLDSLRVRIVGFAGELSSRRKKCVDRFARTVESELKDLGMPRAVFSVSLTTGAAGNPEDMPFCGGERVEFMFSANAGDPPGPLGKIASGGELSRVMLAIKNAIPREQAMTVIFDEVDAGVGGKTADMLGRKLKEIARRHQVICITHLPQVAVWADHHAAVRKYEKDGATDVTVAALTFDTRVEEVTRMLGGESGSKGMEYARELLEKVR